MKTIHITLAIDCSKDVPNLEKLVQGRAYTLDGVEAVRVMSAPVAQLSFEERGTLPKDRTMPDEFWQNLRKAGWKKPIQTGKAGLNMYVYGDSNMTERGHEVIMYNADGSVKSHTLNGVPIKGTK